ncbi:YjbH domain-containing protein [Photobacterium damselae]|uniref:YjbH domain-containing protein n=1 Tax=Photobacterium damselae TaxID=38293 RepID=UPI003C6E85E2
MTLSSRLTTGSIMRPAFALSTITVALLSSFTAQADNFSYPELKHSQSDFGGVGLLQMPTSRMNPEGEFTFGTTYNDDYHHYWVSLQLFPWLETTIRYTQVQDMLYSGDEGFSGNTKYTDKGIDFKLRLLNESYWLPEVSVGVRDFGGTGLFDGEFIAASKQFGPLDFTLGMGWGYIGQRGNITNPFCKVSDSFCQRPSDYKGNGGSFDTGRWFKGPASIYGGVEYQTPFAPLRLKLEYDGNDYSQDFPVTRGVKSMTQATPWNFGAHYQLTDWADAKLSYERGNTLTLGLSLNTNFNDLKASWLDEPEPKANTSQNPKQLTKEEWNTLAQQIESVSGYQDPAIYQSDSVITVVAEQKKYRNRDEAHQRITTLLANSAPTVDEYRIIETKNRQPVIENIYERDDVVTVANNLDIHKDIADITQVATPGKVVGKSVADSQENWDFGLSPVLQQSFGASEGFYLFNIGVNASANYWFNDNLQLGGSVYVNIYDTYDKFKYETPPDGTDNIRVRTLIRQYVNDNPVYANNLQLTWMDKFANNWYAQAYGGYLEMMYGGVGGEVLYRPMNSNWAFGADLNYVKQRDPNSQFGFYTKEVQYDEHLGRNYRVQTGTAVGNITAYYQPQWQWLENTLFKVSAGRYLAEDVGVTIDFSKQFDSGIIAGAFATITDMSTEEYGEGSYTKGFYISIPFDLMTVRPSTERASISWMPLTRDGGQMLNRKYSLYGLTDARSPWYERAPLN